MNLITKRISDISLTKFNDKPSSARVTLTDELIDMGVDLEKGEVVISLIEKNNEKKIVIQKI